MAYDNIVLNPMTKFYLESRTQISAGIVRECGIGNREKDQPKETWAKKLGGK